MTRRRFALPALVLALALFAAACGSDENPALDATGTGDGTGTGTGTGAGAGQQGPPNFPAGTTMAALQQKGKIVIGTKFDQPLFGLKNPVSGEVEGFDVEIGKLMAQGIFGSNISGKVEFKETVSRNREPFIQNGDVDIVIATYTINDTRKQVVDFAGPYYVADQDVMVRADNTNIKTVEDLNGKKVCSATGSTSLKNLQAQAPRADVSIQFDRYSLCAEALGDGRVDAVTTDDSILAGLVNDNPGKYKLVGIDMSDEPYGIGLKKGDDPFREFLNNRLEQIIANGEWARAFERTVGKVMQTPPPPRIDRYGSTGAGAGGGTTTSSTTTSTTGR